MREDNKPLILISNDDGYQAKGINELITFLRPLGELVVMAPDSARSGMSCAITADRPVRYSLVRKEEGLRSINAQELRQIVLSSLLLMCLNVSRM